MIFIDNRRVYDIELRDTPPFPASLRERYEATQLAPISHPDQEFLRWWSEQCAARGTSRPRDRGEDTIQVRRMLTNHTLPELKELGIVFFNHFAEPLKERGYAHHMRLFTHHFRDCQDVLARKVVAANDEEKGTTFG